MSEAIDASIEGHAETDGTRNGTRSKEIEVTLIKLIHKNNRITRSELADALGISVRSVSRKQEKMTNIKLILTTLKSLEDALVLPI